MKVNDINVSGAIEIDVNVEEGIVLNKNQFRLVAKLILDKYFTRAGERQPERRGQAHNNADYAEVRLIDFAASDLVMLTGVSSSAAFGMMTCLLDDRRPRKPTADAWIEQAFANAAKKRTDQAVKTAVEAINEALGSAPLG